MSLVLGTLAEQHHALSGSHAVCPDHGEVLELEPGQAPAPIELRERSDASARLRNAPFAPDHRHEKCPLAATSHAARTPAPDRASFADRTLAGPTAIASAEATPPQRLGFELAPKNSPPRA